MIVVISTGYAAPTREKCLASVAGQFNAAYRHVYIEASTQTPPKPAMQNFYEEVTHADPRDVIAMVDGDDWLPHGDVLARVAQMHDDGALVTYGSFNYSDGRPGFARPYPKECNYREHAWYATHLKTFRAELFHRIDVDDFKIDGEWIRLAWDMAVMFPLLEMAGERAKFCSQVLYTYNLATSFEWSASPQERHAERQSVARIRAKAPYARLT